jgi:hypothetical protein
MNNAVKIISTSHHRNGISGVPFDVTLFQCPKYGRFIAFDFADNGGFGMVNIDQAAKGDIAFGSNSWRGDHYQEAVRAAAAKVKDSVAGGLYVRYTPKQRARK